MPRLELDAHNLTDADVTRVSLVKRGANRLPFRITKGDDEMSIDLGSLLKKAWKPTPVPLQVAAVLIGKTEHREALVTAMQGAGLNFDTPVETEEGTAYQQPDAVDKAPLKMLKIHPDVVLALQGSELVAPVQKDFAPWMVEATTFAEAMATDGFAPGVCMAMEALRKAVSGVLDEAKNPDEAATGIGSAIDQFREYVTSTAKAIPSAAFKAETAVLKVDLSAPAQAATPPANETTTQTTEPPAQQTQKSAGSQEGQGGAQQTQDPTTQSSLPEGLQAALASLIAPIQASLTEGVAALKTEVGGVASKLTALDTRIGQVETLARKTDEAVAGTVAGDPPSDTNRRRRAAKAEGEPPLIDTAYGRPN